ncbi:MAG: transketolase, partial [Chloroflexota bacterium]|nr:transketolase [Chloroflexota bacterium]
DAAKAIEELGGERHLLVQVRKPEKLEPAALPPAKALELPRYRVGDSVATRKAYGEALRALGAANPEVVALDGEVSNSTYAEDFAHAFPDRFFEQYIAEQQLLAATVGFSVRHKIAFASTFAAFFTRAYDFIRMAAISHANLRLCGSHAGVSIGEDGPSQMALEDIAMMRAVHRSTVLYPADGNQTAALVAAMAHHPGISFLRTTREKTPVIYGPDEKFSIGGSKVVRGSASDRATVAAAGITLHEALKAHDKLKEEGIDIRVIDVYSVKPIDAVTLRRCVAETGGRLVTVEDHWAEGGIGDAALEALSESDGSSATSPLPRVVRLAVRQMPGSGKPEEMLAAAGISASHIVEA